MGVDYYTCGICFQAMNYNDYSVCCKCEDSIEISPNISWDKKVYNKFRNFTFYICGECMPLTKLIKKGDEYLCIDCTEKEKEKKGEKEEEEEEEEN